MPSYSVTKLPLETAPHSFARNLESKGCSTTDIVLRKEFFVSDISVGAKQSATSLGIIPDQFHPPKQIQPIVEPVLYELLQFPLLIRESFRIAVP